MPGTPITMPVGPLCPPCLGQIDFFLPGDLATWKTSRWREKEGERKIVIEKMCERERASKRRRVKEPVPGLRATFNQNVPLSNTIPRQRLCSKRR